MSRFRKIESRMWSDDRFRALSPLPPCGQGLWVFLLTGPHTGPVPGLFRAGRAGMAEELGWSLEAFDEAFAEVFAQDMVKADFGARLVWLPNALKHNKPESPNVVRSWRAELDLLPECDLKREALAGLRERLCEYPFSYVEAFDEVVPERYAKALQKASAKASRKASQKTMANQEQEQEQEQKKSPPTPQGAAAGGFETFWCAYPKHVNEAEARKAFESLKPDAALVQRMLGAVAIQAQSEQWTRDGGRYIPLAANWIADKRWQDELPMPDAAGCQAAANAWPNTRSGVEAIAMRMGLPLWDESAFEAGHGELFSAYEERVRRAANQ